MGAGKWKGLYDLKGHFEYAIFKIRKYFQGDVVFLDIGSDEYAASVNFDSSLLVKDKNMAIVDASCEKVYAIGTDAIIRNRFTDKYILANLFDEPYIMNKKLLTQACALIAEQLPLKNTKRKPLIILIRKDRFTDKELKSIVEAFFENGIKCSTEVLLNPDVLKSIFPHIDNPH